MAISLKSGRVIENCPSSLDNWPDRALNSQHLRRFLDVLSVHLCIPVSLPPFHCALWSAFGLPRLPSFSHCASLCLLHLSPFCPRHNCRRRSLFMWVLSHSDTHYLNRHMAWCGCHKILIQPSINILFLTNFSLYPIELWFWWLSYSNHSLQLISIRYSVYRSDPAKTRLCCYQEPFISTSNWRPAHIQRLISCCYSNKARDLIAIGRAPNSLISEIESARCFRKMAEVSSSQQ